MCSLTLFLLTNKLKKTTPILLQCRVFQTANTIEQLAKTIIALAIRLCQELYMFTYICLHFVYCQLLPVSYKQTPKWPFIELLL